VCRHVAFTVLYGVHGFGSFGITHELIVHTYILVKEGIGMTAGKTCCYFDNNKLSLEEFLILVNG
jgi:hypothetical protein